MGNDSYVSLGELASEFGLDKSCVRKYIINQGFTFSKVRDGVSRQMMNVVSLEEAEQIREVRRSQGFTKSSQVIVPQDGYFYIILLYPDLSGKRIKLGFATTVQSRLLAHRTVAPTAMVLASWFCKSAWEKAAIASVAREGCVLVANEVYDCENVDDLIERGKQFFALMPMV